MATKSKHHDKLCALYDDFINTEVAPRGHGYALLARLWVAKFVNDWGEQMMYNRDVVTTGIKNEIKSIESLRVPIDIIAHAALPRELWKDESIYWISSMKRTRDISLLVEAPSEKTPGDVPIKAKDTRCMRYRWGTLIDTLSEASGDARMRASLYSHLANFQYHCGVEKSYRGDVAEVMLRSMCSPEHVHPMFGTIDAPAHAAWDESAYITPTPPASVYGAFTGDTIRFPSYPGTFCNACDENLSEEPATRYDVGKLTLFVKKLHIHHACPALGGKIV